MSAPVPKRDICGAVSRYSTVLKRANTHAGGRIANSSVFSAVPMSVDIFATSKEIAEELEFVARWACAGDDIFDLRPSIERIASFLPFFQRCITDVWTAAADNDLLARIRSVDDRFIEFE